MTKENVPNDPYEPFMVVNEMELKAGWTHHDLTDEENDGGVSLHHEHVVIRKLDDGNYVVRNPEVLALEEIVKYS